MRSKNVWIAIGLFTSLVLSPLARSSNVVTDAEIAVLPPYCQARLGKDEALKKIWSDRLGRDQFLHMHHFCFGLAFMSRARMEINKKDRRFTLQGAVRNFDYVLARWPATFPLTAQAQGLKSQALTMLGSR